MNKISFRYINTVLFIGAGGTGGHLIPNALRMFANDNSKSTGFKVIIADPDIVEERNIARQNFIGFDIGKNKARVLAERYSQYYNLDISYIDQEVNYAYLRDNFSNTHTLIIDSVDNAWTRADINKFIKLKGAADITWISVGNDEDSGQIVVYNPWLSTPRTVVDIWPDDFSRTVINAEEELERARSCGENNVIFPQSIAINETAANIVKNILYQIAYDNEIKYDVVLFDRYNYCRRILAGEAVYATTTTEQANLAAAFNTSGDNDGDSK